MKNHIAKLYRLSLKEIEKATETTCARDAIKKLIWPTANFIRRYHLALFIYINKTLLFYMVNQSLVHKYLNF